MFVYKNCYVRKVRKEILDFLNFGFEVGIINLSFGVRVFFFYRLIKIINELD